MKLLQNKKYIVIYIFAIFFNSAFFFSFSTASSEAPAQGIIWKSEAQGVAKDGIFKRTIWPSFQFAYPLGSTKAELRRRSQIMRMKTPAGVLFYAIIIDIPDGVKLEDFGPVFIVEDFLRRGVGTNLKVTFNKEITLKCGTKAYQTNFTWLWDNTVPITTFQVSAYKDGKCIFLCVHPSMNPYKYESIVQSLTFK